MEQNKTIGKNMTIKALLEGIMELPIMPETASNLMLLRNDINADIKDLSAIIERDPSLAAQIMRYAQLSIFGYGGKITSIQKAISLVIGFDTALHMSLGLALGKTLRMQRQGPLGLQNYSRHAILSATLAQRLAEALHQKSDVAPGLCYLAGLLHNFGFLILGHFQPKEYALFNNMLQKGMALPVQDLELHIFGVRHEKICTWLFEKWNMPEEVIIAVREHHYPDYEGKHAHYAKAVMIADRLLAQHHLGDCQEKILPAELLTLFNLNEAHATTMATELLDIAHEFDSLAMQMAA